MLSNDLIQSVYETPEPNCDINLGEETVGLTVRQQPVYQKATIKLRLLPRPSLRIEVDLHEDAGCPWLLFEDIGHELTFTESGTHFDAFAVNIHGNRIILTPSSTPIRMPTTSETCVSRVVFHIFNFPTFFCTGAPQFDLSLVDEKGRMQRVGRVMLEVDGWIVEIAGNVSTNKLVGRLKETGGYAITHLGRVQRADRCNFSTEDAAELLACLHYFLSFACGYYVSPGLAVGFDDNGQRVWQEWGSGQLDSWSTPASWFDRHHGEILAQIFPGFYGLWKHRLWSKTLKESIYWYLRSNRAGSGAGVDGSLILAQAALERVAWLYVVKDKCLVSAAGFDRLRASDKLRILLTSLEIPKDIPTALAETRNLGRLLKWVDGPQALTETRNHLVHPSDKHTELFSKVYAEAWRLAQWYLDLIVLRLCGHNGEYGNRINQQCVGQVEQVPWASQKKEDA